MDLLHYLVSFIVAVAVLIIVHELGHYAVARWCGVKVLRFSVGFGKPLLVRRFGVDRTEWALGAFPLGGYVKMLDEREAPVDPTEQPRAFNRQPVRSRLAIVAAGPIANFLFAIFLYWSLFVHGTQEFRAVLAAPPNGTIAQQAGFREGDVVVALDGDAVATWNEFRWSMMKRALDRVEADVEVREESGAAARRRLDLSGVERAAEDPDILGQIGFQLYRPRVPAVIGKLVAGGAAERGGIRLGDRVVAIGESPIETWDQLVTIVRDAAGKPLRFHVLRDGRDAFYEVVPEEAVVAGRAVGRIGAVVAEQPGMRDKLLADVRYGVFGALHKAVWQTWETSVFSLQMFGKMLTGEISWKNLSGPVTIADYAGQSARMGVAPYLKFLALISISLGVLNLLPIPLLDGGHLMYYMIEWIKGGPVSERIMEIGQQVGLAILLMLMGFAFYNDINRLVSG